MRQRQSNILLLINMILDSEQPFSVYPKPCAPCLQPAVPSDRVHPALAQGGGQVALPEEPAPQPEVGASTFNQPLIDRLRSNDSHVFY